jgi:nicotinamide mononucleotide transporter
MKGKIGSYQEENRTARRIETVLMVLFLAAAAAAYAVGAARINADCGSLSSLGAVEMTRDESLEDYDADSTVCDVTWRAGEDYLVVSYTWEQYQALDQTTITAYGYQTSDGSRLFFDHPDPTAHQIRATYQARMAEGNMTIFNLATSLVMLSLALSVTTFFGKLFSTYEKGWFLSIMVLATAAALLFPEESANGVNGIVIMALYLLDTFLNILCELLISKQSRYNFLVSVAVEITEIVTCLILMYRFATMVVTLFFWLPIDILSYINWSKHKDRQQDELTAVRRLKGWQEALVIAAIAVWTVVVGGYIAGLDIRTDFYHGDRSLETTIGYLDACASAVGIANGLFIFFRMREQWIAWYLCALLEAVINVLTGQYVLLVLKLGYFTNTTYGYIRWSRYIKSHQPEKASLF